MLAELIDQILDENPELARKAQAHNQGFAGFDVPSETQAIVRQALRDEYGDTISLYHGSDVEIHSGIEWKENSSFTDEFDLEFAGESGWIVVAKVPVERIKFYLNWEREFVLTAGKLNCEVYTVVDYFSL